MYSHVHTFSHNSSTEQSSGANQQHCSHPHNSSLFSFTVTVKELCVSVCSVPPLYTPSHKAEVKVWNILYLFMMAVGPGVDGESSDQ